MKLKPVEEKTRPIYPTLNEFLTRKPAAGDHVEGTARPGRWSHWGKGIAGAAVFCLAFNVGGCDTSSRKHTDGRTVVAPVFDHGVGRGSTGCIVVAPPSFLSEEEAMAIIKDELAKHGVTLGEGEILKDVVVQIPCHNRFDFAESEKQPRLVDPRPLDVDAIDKGRDVAVEFVSTSDCQTFEVSAGLMSSVSSFNPKEVASNLAASAQKSGGRKRYVGFFYDPIAESREPGKLEDRLPYEEEKQRRQKECKELLRQQVQDFAAWLEEQEAEGQPEEETETPPKST